MFAPSMNRSSRLASVLPVLLYAISGAAMLVAETTWMRWLREWMGATAPAVAATTSAYFVGSSVGAWLGAQQARRSTSRVAAMRSYARVELLAAAGTVAVPFLMEAASLGLSAAYPWLVVDGGVLAAVRFTAALIVTLPAAAAFGATFPWIGAAALGAPRSMGTGGLVLYAAGATGSVLGVALASWWGPPRIGIHGTYGVGVLLGLLAAAGALGWATMVEGASRPGVAAKPSGVAVRRDPAPEGRGVRERLSGVLVALSVLSGAVALGAQVLLVNAFALVVNQSVIAFGAVLMAVLSCLALGAATVAIARARGLASSRGLVGWALVASAGAFGFTPWWIHRTTNGLEYVTAGLLGLPYGPSVVVTVLLGAGPALWVAACVWPATLAWAGDEVGRPDRSGRRPVDPEPGRPPGEDASAGREAGYRLGVLAAANSLGALVGGIVTPFFLLPRMGPWGAFAALAGVCGLGALWVPPATRESRWVRPLVVAGGAALVLGLADPFALPLTRPIPGVDVIFEESGAAGIVSVLEKAGQRALRVDGHYGLGGTSEQTHEERQGHVPLLLHPRPERVAFVGTATGITAGAATFHGVEAITLVEIVPDVARAGATFFADANRGVYGDRRSRVVVDDARNFFRHTDERFDVIVADLFVPWRAGTGALYTREHFDSMRDRLRPGGLLAQWLPLYQLSEEELSIVVATFSDVFGTVALFRGDFYGAYPIVALIGWRDGPASVWEVERSLRGLGAAGVGDRWVTDPEAFWSLYVGSIDPSGLTGVARNLAAWPRLEFLAAERHVGGARGKVDALVGLDWVRWVERSPEPGADDASFPGLSRDALRSVRGGRAFQKAGALHAAGRDGEAARHLERAAELLPRSVLADAPADPTAAEVWFDRSAEPRRR